MPRSKGATDSKRRKRKATPPASQLRAACEQRYRARWGREWADADRARLLEEIGTPPSELTAARRRGALVFLALREGSALATGETSGEGITDLDLAVVSFLAGLAELPGGHRRMTAAAVLDRERAALAKTRADRARRLAALTAPGAVERFLDALMLADAKKTIADLLDEGRFDLAAKWAQSLTKAR